MTYFFVLLAAALLVAVSFVYYHHRKTEKTTQLPGDQMKIVPSSTATILSTQRPPAYEPQAVKGPSLGATERLTDKKMMVVDDQASIRLMLIELFASEGVEVFEAENASAAMGLLREVKLDCVLLDFKLPDKDGIDVLRELRQLSAEVPVVLITGYAEPVKLEEAMKLGISQCFTKPFDIIELKEVVLRLMK